MNLTRAEITHALTIVLAPVGVIVTAWGAKQGFNLPVAECVTAGATAGGGLLFMGWHLLEKQPTFEKAKADFDEYFQKLVAAARETPGLNDAVSGILHSLESQKAEIIAALEKTAHAPTSIDNIINELVNAKQQLVAQGVGTSTSGGLATGPVPNVIPVPMQSPLTSPPPPPTDQELIMSDTLGRHQ